MDLCRQLVSAVVSNWPLILVGIGGVVAALKTLSAIQRQADIYQRQTDILQESVSVSRTAAEAARNSAAATLKSVEAFKNAERAWVEARLTKKGPAVYQLEIVNCGRTVAKITGYMLKPVLSRIKEGIPEFPVIDEGTLFRSSKLLVPSDEPWIPAQLNLVVILGREDFDLVWENRRGFSYYGVIHYKDISDEPHLTEFCYYFDFESDKTLFRVEAPEYNRHT
jgi:hypothetical protein